MRILSTLMCLIVISVFFFLLQEELIFERNVTLEAAIFRHNTKLMKRKIAEGYDVNATTADTYGTILTRACQPYFHPGYGLYPVDLDKKEGKLVYEMLKILLENGASKSVNVTDAIPRGRAPLHYVVASHGIYPRDKERIIKLLISYGADINLRTCDGRTPLDVAIRDARSYETVEILIENGADVNLKTAEEKTPLQLAVENGSTEISDLLRKNGAKE